MHVIAGMFQVNAVLTFAGHSEEKRPTVCAVNFSIFKRNANAGQRRSETDERKRIRRV